MNRKKDPVREELARAGEASQITPSLRKLDGCRIMTDTDVPEEDFLMRFNGKACFPRRDLTAITGLEKCGKTFYTSMLMACCAKPQVLALERIPEQPLRVMWYDTEQSRPTTKSIFANRVAGLVGKELPEDEFFVFNVRSCTYDERMDYLVAGIEAYRPDLVIIDNVSELLPSINDPEKTVEVVGRLMELATLYACNISLVIHLNRTGEKRNLRGWLGTEILHKAYEAYCCEQVQKTDVFSVEQLFSRKFHTSEKLFYKIDDNGLPFQTDDPNARQHADDGRYEGGKPDAYKVSAVRAATFNQAYILRDGEDARTSWKWDLHKLFGDAMGDCAQLSQEELQRRVMELSHIEQPKYYGKVFDLAVEKRVVCTTLNKGGRVVVISPPS